MAKLIGGDTLESFARAIVAQHKPIAFNWAAKFGLPEISPGSADSRVAAAQAVPPPLPTPVDASIFSEEMGPVANEVNRPKKKLICATCSEQVAFNVARFCWLNKARFGENIYCRECQQAV
jgi:hypothetical protein